MMSCALMPNCCLGIVDGAMQAVDHRVEGDAARVWPCGSKNISTCRTLSARRALQIGERQIVEILLGEQHRHALVIDVEKILQVAKLVGCAHRFDRVVGQLDAVAARQREHQLRLEAALDVDVQLALRQPFDQRIVLVHFRVSRGLCVGFEATRGKRRSRIGTSIPEAGTTCRQGAFFEAGEPRRSGPRLPGRCCVFGRQCGV